MSGLPNIGSYVTNSFGSGSQSQPSSFSGLQRSGLPRPPAPYPSLPGIVSNPGTPTQPRPPAPLNYGSMPTYQPPPPPPPTQKPAIMPPPPPSYQQPPQPPTYPPPPPQQAGNGQWTGIGNLQNDLYNQLSGFQGNPQAQQFASNWLSNPNPYNSPAVQAALSSGQNMINQQFGAAENQAQQAAANRGLQYSSVPVGYLGDLETNRGYALQNLASNVLQGAAQNDAASRAAALSGALGVNAQNFGQQQQLLQNVLNFGQQSFQNQLAQATINNSTDPAMQLAALLGVT